MKHVATPNLEAQLFGLGTLVQLLKRARRAANAAKIEKPRPAAMKITRPVRQYMREE